MFRFAVLTAVALAVLLPTHATAQPAVPGAFQVVDAKADKGELFWNETRSIPVVEKVVVTVVKNGVPVEEVREVTVYKTLTVALTVELKKVKVTDGAGKAITTEKLAELLKDAAPVVIVSAPVAENHRKLFKESTVFVELPPPPKP